MFQAMNAYAVGLREKILQAWDQRFGSQRSIARLFGVSPSFLEKLLRRRRSAGDIAPRPHAGGRPASGDEAALARIRRLIHAHPDATLAELCEHLLTRRGRRVSVPTLSRLAPLRGLPRKKHHSTPASRTPRASSRHVQPPAR